MHVHGREASEATRDEMTGKDVNLISAQCETSGRRMIPKLVKRSCLRPFAVLAALALMLAVTLTAARDESRSQPGVATKRTRALNYSYEPSYEIIDSESIEPSLILRKSAKNSTEQQELLRSLVALKKAVRERQLQQKRQQSSDRLGTSRVKANGTLEDDIGTVNVLLGMLMLANKRLIEQRKLQANATATNGSSGNRENRLASTDKKADRWRPRQSGAADHTLVRAGFGPETSARPADHAGSGSERREELSSAPNVHRPPMLLTQPHSELRDELLGQHKPIVAQDLLNVRPQQPTYSLGPLSETGVLLLPRPIPEYRQRPLFEQLQQHRQPHTVEEEEGPAYPPQPLVPPYNGYSLDWTGVGQQQQQQQPQPQPQPEPDEPPDVARPPHEGPQQQQPGNDLGGQMLMSPIQRMLMAAKSQQAAALAYEQRRLQHEMELEKRQRHMRLQHDQHLERQRQEAEAAARQKSAGEQSSGQDAEQPPAQQQQETENEPADEGAAEQEGGGASEQPKEEDPDMKSFQNFAGDGDFTDLFPPGILSEAEIKEMRKQQEEQRQRQEQEERQERERQQAGQQQQTEQTEPGKEEPGDEQAAAEPDNGTENSQASPANGTDANTAEGGVQTREGGNVTAHSLDEQQQQQQQKEQKEQQVPALNETAKLSKRRRSHGPFLMTNSPQETSDRRVSYGPLQQALYRRAQSGVQFDNEQLSGVYQEDALPMDSEGDR